MYAMQFAAIRALLFLPGRRLSTAAAARHTTTRALSQESSSMQSTVKDVKSWFEDFLKKKAPTIVGVGAGLVGANVLVSSGYRWYYHRCILERLTEGVMPPPDPPAPVPRTDVRDELRGIMRPERPARFYSLILGPPGSGKSTLVRAAARELSGGVGYIDVNPATEDFGTDFGEAFGFKFEREVGIFNLVSQLVLGRKTVDVSSGKLATMRRSAEALHDAACEYKARTGRPFVLVVDSFDRLYKGSEDVFKAFLSYATDWAQDGTINAIFVADHWDTAQAVLGEHPTQGRAAAPLVVGDLSEKEALQLLRHLAIEGTVAQQIVELVGGSLLLLERAAGLHHAGASFAELKARLTQLMTLELEEAGVGGKPGKDENEEMTPGKRAIESLLASPQRTLSSFEWKRAVPLLQDRRTLLSGGVLKFDPGLREVKFMSRLAEVCAEELIKGEGK